MEEIFTQMDLKANNGSNGSGSGFIMYDTPENIAKQSIALGSCIPK